MPRDGKKIILTTCFGGAGVSLLTSKLLLWSELAPYTCPVVSVIAEFIGLGVTASCVLSTKTHIVVPVFYPLLVSTVGKAYVDLYIFQNPITIGDTI